MNCHSYDLQQARQLNTLYFSLDPLYCTAAHEILTCRFKQPERIQTSIRARVSKTEANAWYTLFVFAAFSSGAVGVGHSTKKRLLIANGPTRRERPVAMALHHLGYKAVNARHRCCFEQSGPATITRIICAAEAPPTTTILNGTPSLPESLTTSPGNATKDCG